MVLLSIETRFFVLACFGFDTYFVFDTCLVVGASFLSCRYTDLTLLSVRVGHVADVVEQAFIPRKLSLSFHVVVYVRFLDASTLLSSRVSVVLSMRT